MNQRRPSGLGREPWRRLGFEVELLAEAGASRATLAAALAERSGGQVEAFFHQDTELSLVKGRPVFHHLSRGFEVSDHQGAPVCRLVDDMTIQNELRADAPALDGWFRILSDEPRLLRLIDRLATPSAPADTVLDPVATAFGVTVERGPEGRYRLNDVSGATVAMVAPQGGEGERVCELVTPPITRDHAEALDNMLATARELGSTIPDEAAVHVHLDAEPFRSSAMLARLVTVFSADRRELWQALGTNPACRRLAALPVELVEGVGRPGFSDQPWEQTLHWLKQLELTKFSDCNLVNLRDRAPGKDTVELRILPGALHADQVMQGVTELQRRFGACHRYPTAPALPPRSCVSLRPPLRRWPPGSTPVERHTSTTRWSPSPNSNRWLHPGRSR